MTIRKQYGAIVHIVGRYGADRAVPHPPDVSFRRKKHVYLFQRKCRFALRRWSVTSAGPRKSSKRVLRNAVPRSGERLPSCQACAKRLAASGDLFR